MGVFMSYFYCNDCKTEIDDNDINEKDDASCCPVCDSIDLDYFETK